MKQEWRAIRPVNTVKMIDLIPRVERTLYALRDTS